MAAFKSTEGAVVTGDETAWAGIDEDKGDAFFLGFDCFFDAEDPSHEHGASPQNMHGSICLGISRLWVDKVLICLRVKVTNVMNRVGYQQCCLVR
jgi:hypothetical protein